VKIQPCRHCNHKPTLQKVAGPSASGLWYTYVCRCGATPDVYDGTRLEAIERWNATHGERSGAND